MTNQDTLELLTKVDSELAVIHANIECAEKRLRDTVRELRQLSTISNEDSKRHLADIAGGAYPIPRRSKADRADGEATAYRKAAELLERELKKCNLANL